MLGLGLGLKRKRKVRAITPGVVVSIREGVERTRVTVHRADHLQDLKYFVGVCSVKVGKRVRIGTVLGWYRNGTRGQ